MEHTVYCVWDAPCRGSLGLNLPSQIYKTTALTPELQQSLSITTYIFTLCTINFITVFFQVFGLICLLNTISLLL